MRSHLRFLAASMIPSYGVRAVSTSVSHRTPALARRGDDVDLLLCAGARAALELGDHLPVGDVAFTVQAHRHRLERVVAGDLGTGLLGQADARLDRLSRDGRAVGGNQDVLEHAGSSLDEPAILVLRAEYALQTRHVQDAHVLLLHVDQALGLELGE